MRRSTVMRGVRVASVAGASLALATLATWVLEGPVGVGHAAVVYIVAVAVTAVVAGTPGAIGASIGAFILYDFFFVVPRFTLRIHDSQEWLDLLLLLFVATLVGQLAATQRRRTEAAREREREARALFRVSRALATRTSSTAAATAILADVVEETVATRAWLELSGADGVDRIAVDTAPDRPRPAPPTVSFLRRTEGEAPAEWARVHVGARPAAQGQATDRDDTVHKVVMEAGGRRVGALWALVPRDVDRPGPTDTRLLAAVADQLAQAVQADRLAAESRAAAVARESDRLKTALLETVSHDLRTPLAAIRAAAGTLMDPSVELDPEERLAVAATIDQDADRLNRIVTNVLDLSRVEGGALRPQLDGYDLPDLVETAVERARPRLGDRAVEVAVGDPPPVRVDPTFLGQVLDNLLENVVRYTPGDAPVAVSVAAGPAEMVRLTVEDGGPGVPEDAMPRLFDKFYRVSSRGPAARAGSGIGMAVVRGLVEAMGGAVSARTGRLGGLAIDLDLPMAAADGDA